MSVKTTIIKLIFGKEEFQKTSLSVNTKPQVKKMKT